ncbi:PREDICTED: uncharacterized protein LOC109190284 [Ipomoea nil]|uniref:uncharacterized protein LOC109190284 n=1 Tax=Ipomoea nil TaxID=35883 RepID=UPI000900D43A|nr:PREDICTED: uncharacterized protein LOC109190284 [Ipomoea nil]
MEQGVKLFAGEGEPFEDLEKYRRLVGKLNYLIITRPDIAFPEAVIRIVKYLKDAPGKGILYANHGYMGVEAFFDADWAGSPSDRKSMTGYCVFVGGNLVSWKNKKQNVVSRSSAESEYRAMAHVASEIVWVHNILKEVGVEVKLLIDLWFDNCALIHIASNPVFHQRTKHIEVDCHFIREKVEQELISLTHVRSGDLLADIFTKGLCSCPRILMDILSRVST